MKCYHCGAEACAKIGESKGSLLKALLGRKCWSKSEIYVCKAHFLDYRNGGIDVSGCYVDIRCPVHKCYPCGCGKHYETFCAVHGDGCEINPPMMDGKRRKHADK